jgi:predicted nucleic acid-binding protein
MPGTGKNREMHLFYTDILSSLFKKVPSRRLLRNLERIPPQEQFVSTITIGEIALGAAKSDRRDFHLRNLILVSGNESHFQRINELRVDNWH